MLAERLAAQGLSGPKEKSVEAVVDRLLAVQAQDLKAAKLALRARSEGSSVEAVDRALSEERSVVVSWLNRGTLHLVRSEDFSWLHALTAHRLDSANRRRLAEEGVSPADTERGVETIRRALSEEGPLTRQALKARLDSADVPTAGQALVHLIFRATLECEILRGPIVGNEQAFVLAADWLGPLPPVDREVALAELARRYLTGHGPATDRDLAKWAGLPLGQARTGLKRIAFELRELQGGGVDLVNRGRRAQSLPPPRLLGAFDPILHGWVSRDFLIPRAQDRKVVTVNGIFKPTILVEGQVVGTWTMPGGEIQLQPFRRLGRKIYGALDEDAAAMARFLA